MVNGAWPNSGGISEAVDGKTALDGAGIETVMVESTARHDCWSSVLEPPWTGINVGRLPSPDGIETTAADVANDARGGLSGSICAQSLYSQR